jgi:LysR family hydrogen peroxide-inducible transcriptional activator
VNLKDLKYIVAVAEMRHFGRAAERCFVSQPTLSGQIRKLEEQLGVVIFERTNRSVEVTPVGEEIVQRARQALEQTDAMVALAQAHRDPLAGPLRIGAIPTLSPYLMPLILMPLRRDCPQMRLVLSEETTATLLRRLHAHEIDAALLATPVEDDDLAETPLFDEPFWIAYPRQHRFYEQEQVTLADLDIGELLLLGEDHCLARQAMDLCAIGEGAQRRPMADLRAASLETLIQLVGAGYGCTLVPALAMRGSWTSGSGVVAQPLAAPQAFRRVTLAYRSSYPRKQALLTLVQVIAGCLPNTVRTLSSI